MTLNDLGLVLFLGFLLVMGLYLWSIPVYRKYRLAQLKRVRAQKRLDK